MGGQLSKAVRVEKALASWGVKWKLLQIGREGGGDPGCKPGPLADYFPISDLYYNTSK